MADPSTLYTAGGYAAAHPRWHSEDSAWKAAHIVRILERNRVSPETVCEVGCGAGEILKQLHDLLPPSTRFTGREVSPQAYEMCRERATDRLRFELTGSLEAPEPFDLVLAIDVLEHVPDYLGFLAGLRSAGRHKVLHIPLDLSVQTVLRSTPMSRLRREVGHLHFFTRQTALDALAGCGYTILDAAFTSPSTELAPASALMRIARWPRRLGYRLAPELAVRVLGGHSLLVLAT